MNIRLDPTGRSSGILHSSRTPHEGHPFLANTARRSICLHQSRCSFSQLNLRCVLPVNVSPHVCPHSACTSRNQRTFVPRIYAWRHYTVRFSTGARWPGVRPINSSAHRVVLFQRTLIHMHHHYSSVQVVQQAWVGGSIRVGRWGLELGLRVWGCTQGWGFGVGVGFRFRRILQKKKTSRSCLGPEIFHVAVWSVVHIRLRLELRHPRPNSQ